MGTEFEFERVGDKTCKSEQRNAEGSPVAADGEAVADRRTFLQSAVASAAALALPKWVRAAAAPAASADEMDGIRAEIEKRHDEAVQRLQHWIQQPSIAAENRGMAEGCELTVNMLRDAGFEQVTKVPDRRPARNFRHAGRGCAAHRWPLFHVRREASRSRGVEFAAVQSSAGR